jgi:hypothetical protein
MKCSHPIERSGDREIEGKEEKFRIGEHELPEYLDVKT